MCIEAGPGGIFAAKDANNLDALTASLQDFSQLAYTITSNDISSLVKSHVVEVKAPKSRAQRLTILSTFIGNGDVNVLQAPYNDTTTDPRQNRWSLQISEVRNNSKIPHGYLRAETKVGMELITQMNNVLDSNQSQHVLGWRKQSSTSLLMSGHYDQTGVGRKADVDAKGNPSGWTIRTLDVGGAPSQVRFTLVAYEVVEKDAADYDDEDDEEDDDVGGVMMNSTSKSYKSQKYKLKSHKLGTFDMILGGDGNGGVSDTIRSYTLSAVGAGRHPLGKIRNPTTNRWEVLILLHSPGRVNRGVNYKSRICLITDSFYTSKESSDAAMAKIRQGIDQEVDVASIADAVKVDLTSLVTTPASIDSSLSSVEPFNPFGTIHSFECLLCKEAAKYFDKRNLRNQQARVTNVNKTEVGVGCRVKVYYNKKEEICESSEDGADEYPGIITHIDKSPGNQRPITVTGHEQGSTFAGSAFADMFSTDCLYPSNTQNPTEVDGAAVELSARCIVCMSADSALFDQAMNKCTDNVLAIKDICHSCFQDEKLGNLRACASCLGDTRCRGYDKNGTQTWVCKDRESEEGGVLLSNDNIHPSGGSICPDCLSQYNSQYNGTNGEEFYKSSETFFSAIFTAMVEQPDMYAKIWGGKLVPIYPALVGGVENVPRIDAVFKPYQADYEKLLLTHTEEDALEKIADRIRKCYSYKFIETNKKSTIEACPEKCNDCKTGDCEWVGKDITDLKSFEEYVKHGGKFAKEAMGRNGRKRKVVSSNSMSSGSGTSLSANPVMPELPSTENETLDDSLPVTRAEFDDLEAMVQEVQSDLSLLEKEIYSSISASQPQSKKRKIRLKLNVKKDKATVPSVCQSKGTKRKFGTDLQQQPSSSPTKKAKTSYRWKV